MTWLALLILLDSVCFARYALVLSGGGAKGAFEVGALTVLCEQFSDSQIWELITGASIGALNGGVLAQFNRSQQCSLGVPALFEFWSEIKTETDVYKAPTGNGPCLETRNVASLAESWLTTAGLCDGSPGQNMYRKHVNESKLYMSDMPLIVPASPLTSTYDAVWFSDQTPLLLEGILASGALSPLIPSKEVDFEWYVDGGLFHNTPIVKALEQGATTIYAILLDPLKSNATTSNQRSRTNNVTDAPGGVRVLTYMMDTIVQNMFLSQELRQACLEYPHANILGILPATRLNSTISFDAPSIAAMYREGQEAARRGMVDMCQVFGMPRSRSTPPSPSTHNPLLLSLLWAASLVACLALGFAVGTFHATDTTQRQRKRLVVAATEIREAKAVA
eukprot:c2443_g1_i1.p1 GENE.c2443_g1_i1~~c2443_g1_i1.p1  ORF type:complete len:402 (+),score=87.20 c2443_g1_i1:31-1206(+)